MPCFSYDAGMAAIYDTADALPSDVLATCRRIPHPPRLLMCPPTHFAVIDVKNPHMAANVGAVNRNLAMRQWHLMRDAFERCGVAVQLIEPAPDCEDMVFCANQTLVGRGPDGGLLCLLSNMKHSSRQREVPAFARWFGERGYRVESLTTKAVFEGSGDAIWHPGRGLIWGGHGYRTQPEAYEEISRRFDVPVLRLRLTHEHFYHLDTCFCAIDERTALVHPRGLAPEALEMVRAVFDDVIEAPDPEALIGMACNACALRGRSVVIQAGNATTTAALRSRGFDVVEVDTSEFMKSGGSVFCMKMYLPE